MSRLARRALATVGHLAVDFLQVLDRNADALLQFQQPLLDDGVLVSFSDSLYGFSSSVLGDPVQIIFVAEGS